MRGAVLRPISLLAAGLLLLGLLLGVRSPALAASCPGDATPQAVGTSTVVFLVHGFESSASAWGPAGAAPGSDSMLGALRGLNHAYVVTFDYSAVHDRWVTNPAIGPALARQIQCYADASAVHGTGKVVLVGHSMGGLAIRCALAQSCGGVAGNDRRAGEVITLGTPNTGSLLQPPGVSAVQTTAGYGLYLFCDTVSWAELRQNDLLNSICSFLHAGATSEAGHAFIQGSAEMKALPKFPAGLPVHGLAGEASFGTEIFFYHSDASPAGDFVIGVGSATAATVDEPPIVVDCGKWYVQYLSPAVWVQPGTCWHGSETSVLPFRQDVVGLVSDYVTLHGCGVNNNATAVSDAVRKLPVDTYPWSTDVRDYDGNYDPCATLSSVVVPIAGGTASSSRTVLLFHKGTFVGTGTTDNWPMAFFDAHASSDDTVTVDYSYLRAWDPDNAGASGRASLGFRWDGNTVQTLGTLPADMTHPPPYGAKISLDGYGPAFSWGVAQAQAEAGLGATFTSLGGVGPGCEQATLEGIPNVVFGIQDGKVVVGAVLGKGIGNQPTTDTGVSLGDPVSKIATYPGVVISADPSDAFTTRYTYTSGGRTAQFLSSDQATVTAMQFGLSGAVGEAPCV